jgi:23S rRNA (cytosine1962-C5)-methyltransferase
MDVAAAIAAAYARRAALHADPSLDCYRLMHGWSEGCPGVEMDRYGDSVVLEVKPHVAPPVEELVAGLDRCRAFPRVVVRERPGGVRSARGELPAGRVVVHESGLRYLVDLARNGNPGLFLDARPARAWIRASSSGRRVLNLFAFSGSLGVAALAGGARSIVHVDAVQKVLDWCRANHVENGQPIDDRSLARMNVYQHLRKSAASRQRFGAIIADPPPGPEDPRPGDNTPGGRGAMALVPQLARMLEPDGWLLTFLHHGLHDPDQAAAGAIAAAAEAGLALERCWRATSDDDFPEDDPRRKLHLIAYRRVG